MFLEVSVLYLGLVFALLVPDHIVRRASRFLKEEKIQKMYLSFMFPISRKTIEVYSVTLWQYNRVLSFDSSHFLEKFLALVHLKLAQSIHMTG